MKKELIQLQHQFKDKKTGMFGTETDFIAQQKISGPAEMREFFEETNKSHPLPKDAQWLIVKEGSEFFYYSGTLENGEECLAQKRYFKE